MRRPKSRLTDGRATGKASKGIQRERPEGRKEFVLIREMTLKENWHDGFRQPQPNHIKGERVGDRDG